REAGRSRRPSPPFGGLLGGRFPPRVFVVERVAMGPERLTGGPHRRQELQGKRRVAHTSGRVSRCSGKPLRGRILGPRAICPGSREGPGVRQNGGGRSQVRRLPVTGWRSASPAACRCSRTSSRP